MPVRKSSVSSGKLLLLFFFFATHYDRRENRQGKEDPGQNFIITDMYVL